MQCCEVVGSILCLLTCAKAAGGFKHEYVYCSDQQTGTAVEQSGVCPPCEKVAGMLRGAAMHLRSVRHARGNLGGSASLWKCCGSEWLAGLPVVQWAV